MKKEKTKNNVLSGKISQWLHPDSLMCEEYEEHQLDLDSFTSPSAPWEIIDGNGDQEKRMAAELISADGAAMRVQVLDTGMLRLRVRPRKGQEKRTSPSSWQPSTTEKLGLLHTDQFKASSLDISEDNTEVKVKSGEIEYRHDISRGDFTVIIDGEPAVQSMDGGVRFSSEPPEYGGHRSFAGFKLNPDESVWGFGGRVRPLNRHGVTIDIFSEKVGKLYGDYGGFPIPYFISSRGYGVFFNNPWPHVYFDMGATWSDRWFLTAPGGEFDLFVIRGPEVADIVRRFTALAGRIAPPPKFLFGFWVSSLSFETAEEMQGVAKRLREEDYPCDNVVLDGPWRGGPEFIAHYKKYHEYMNNDLEWHPDFGDGASMLRSLHSDGYKVALHLNSRVFKRETAAEGLARGLLRQHEEEVVVKLEDTDGERFFLDLLEPRIEEGVDMWWTDHTDRVSGEIKPGIPSRNLFGPLWNRLLANAMFDAGKEERLSLSRGGGIGSQRYALPWPGDTASGLNRFAEDIWFCLSAGLAGFPITSVDMGGFTLPELNMGADEANESVFGKENLHRRLFQSIMFVPAPRIHNNYQGVPRLPWNCAPESRDLYRKFLKERYRLTPYFYSLGLESADTGEPVTRPLFYHFLDDPNTHDISDVFLLGENLLMAPVVEEKAKSRIFYLPEANWYNYWTGEMLVGGRDTELPCPVDQTEGLPMLVRAGSIIPLQEPTDFLSPDPPEKLQLNIYPDEHGRAGFLLREGADMQNKFELKPHPSKSGIFHLFCQNNTEEKRTYQFVSGDSKRALVPIDKKNDNISVPQPGIVQLSIDQGDDRLISLRFEENLS